MKIIDKIMEKQEKRTNAKSVTIVALGDSITEGCFECFMHEDGKIGTVFERTSSYSARLQELLAKLYPMVQVNVVNSGVSGASLPDIERTMDRDVLSFNPDLVIVSYGLNDCQKGLGGIAEYKERLCAVLEQIKQGGAEIIFLTQNYMCTTVSPHIPEPFLKGLAKTFSESQKAGVLEAYFDAAKEVCLQYGAEVCDLYSVWKTMDASGVNVTELLSNKLNHPIREYHYYIAIKLLEKMLGV